MRKIRLFILAWFLCGIYASGTMYALFHSEFEEIACKDRRQDAGFSILIGFVWGPVAALVAFPTSGFNEHGWGPWNDGKVCTQNK